MSPLLLLPLIAVRMAEFPSTRLCFFFSELTGGVDVVCIPNVYLVTDAIVPNICSVVEVSE
jgi:hypothetical protein